MKPKIIFMGTPDFAVPILHTLIREEYNVVAIVTQPDRPKGRKKIITPPPVKEAAMKWGIPVYQPERIRTPESVAQILQLKSDLIITAAYGQILPEELLQSPTYGCINVHASLLPKYRGGAPIHWAVIRGEKETGITLMYMVPALDAGDIISQRKIPILPDDHVGSLHDRLSQLGAVMIKDTLPSLLAGEIKAIPQDEEQVTYAPNINREDEIIDWHHSATQVYNHVRGLNPFPGACTYWQGKRLNIWWVEKSEESSLLSPGTVVQANKEGILVATGEGGIWLKEIQLTGKKRLPVKAFLAGTRLKEGDVLGHGS